MLWRLRELGGRGWIDRRLRPGRLLSECRGRGRRRGFGLSVRLGGRHADLRFRGHVYSMVIVGHVARWVKQLCLHICPFDQRILGGNWSGLTMASRSVILSRSGKMTMLAADARRADG